jgi:hypothetical protein
MPTPRKGYFLADGTKVPGTTTILGRFKESGALLKWAWNRGREFPNEDLYATRDEAGNVGTAAHAMVEARIAGEDPEKREELLALDAPGREKARNAFSMYEAWAAQSRLEIVAQEMQLVSETYRFGGTPDAIGRIGAELCLVDWKTSNGVYSDYLLQLAAYRLLWEEVHPDQPLTGGFHLCRFSKEHGDFAHHYYRELDSAREMFIHLRAAYEFDKELRKRAA